MTKFAETNGAVTHVDGYGHYAACTATGCTWVGPFRSTPAAAKRDAVRHHDSDRA